MSHPKKHHDEPDASKSGVETGPSDNMRPKEPSQAELDADRKANPDTSEEQSKQGYDGG